MRLRFDVIESEVLLEEGAVDFDALARLVGAFMESRGLGGYEEISVSLSVVGEPEIERLNAQYRDIDEPTDVLSFPLWEENGIFSPPASWTELPLGDVVVSPSYIQENAKKEEVDYNREIVLVIVHGVLHLIGYDHDTEERKAGMWREQEALVEEYLKQRKG